MAAEAEPPSPTPMPLPVHLQSAVQLALGDLKAQRLLYPQQCAAAEELGQSERKQAERCAGQQPQPLLLPTSLRLLFTRC